MDPRERRRTLRMLSNGMYVVTARSGDRFGAATVTWVSQASFKPPLIMAAIRPDSNVFRCLRKSRMAAIHILGGEQADLAQRFFAPTRAEADTLNDRPFTDGKTSAPVLRDAPAYVECVIRQVIETGGDHAVVIMELLEAECRRPVRPLTIGESPWTYGG
jgi:flavin reductase (DIM6/NTAB) family NADH-FMN oxidoreductase RutF